MNYWQLKQRQSLPLSAKIIHTENIIRQWYDYWKGDIYVSFSGGKDSTVLLHIVRSLYPSVPAVFVNTGLEYPEIKEFVKSIPNVITLIPEISFKDVISKYGYPILSKKISRQLKELQNPTPKNIRSRRLILEGFKQDGTKTKSFKLSKSLLYLVDSPYKFSDKCCDILKKNPIHLYRKKTKQAGFVGTLASDSIQRRVSYLKVGGCNNFNSGVSTPLSIWNREDINNYISINNLKISDVYKTETHTGCIFCMFGIQFDGEYNRFQRLKILHPKLYDYCMNILNIKDVLSLLGYKY